MNKQYHVKWTVYIEDETGNELPDDAEIEVLGPDGTVGHVACYADFKQHGVYDLGVTGDARMWFKLPQ